MYVFWLNNITLFQKLQDFFLIRRTIIVIITIRIIIATITSTYISAFILFPCVLWFGKDQRSFPVHSTGKLLVRQSGEKPQKASLYTVCTETDTVFKLTTGGKATWILSGEIVQIVSGEMLTR